MGPTDEHLWRRGSAQQGKTLAELAVVVAIVGILAGLTVPHFMSYLARAKQVAAKGNLGSIALDEELYFNVHGSYSDLTTIGFKPLALDAYQYRVGLANGGFTVYAFARSTDNIVPGCGVLDEWTVDQDHVLCAVHDCFGVGPYCSGLSITTSVTSNGKDAGSEKGIVSVASADADAHSGTTADSGTAKVLEKKKTSVGGGAARRVLKKRREHAGTLHSLGETRLPD